MTSAIWFPRRLQPGVPSLFTLLLPCVLTACAMRTEMGSKPSTSWKENPQPGERKKVERFVAEVLVPQQQHNRDGKLRRAFHRKTHVGLIAEFRVLPGLPDHARQGVFKEPQTYPAAARFSNGEASSNPDRKPEPRGIAVKLIGVTGKKLPERVDDPPENRVRGNLTQDFLATSHSLTSTVRNADQFMTAIKAKNEGHLVSGLAHRFGVAETARIMIALLRTVRFSDVRSMATEHYGGTAPIKYGPYAVKFTVQPSAGTRPPLKVDRKDPDFLRKELAARLKEGDLVFDFVVQFFADENRTPIEDTSVRWQPRVGPLKVAELRIPRQNIDTVSAKALSDKIDRLSFTPWHAIEDHRPLGSIMRARRIAYPVSSTNRHCLAEPTHLQP